MDVVSEMFLAHLQFIPSFCRDELFFTCCKTFCCSPATQPKRWCSCQRADPNALQVSFLFPHSVLQLLNTCAMFLPRRVEYIQPLTSRLLVSIYSSLFTRLLYFCCMFFFHYRPRLLAQKRKTVRLNIYYIQKKKKSRYNCH